MTQDGIELADLLRKQLGKDKIVLVGHSWGSILGVHMVKARPEHFYAFVGTGQAGDSATSYTVAHRELLKKVAALEEERALRELREVGPPPYADGRGYGVQRRWSNFLRGRRRVHHVDGWLRTRLSFATTPSALGLRLISAATPDTIRRCSN
jgi:pimeloyl-ACP methyl ester carboxylesterase